VTTHSRVCGTAVHQLFVAGEIHAQAYSGALVVGGIALLSFAALWKSLPPDASYRPLSTQPLSVVRAADEAEKPALCSVKPILRARYDLSDQRVAGEPRPYTSPIRHY
jgi:hypothetical protein